jgi:hypothetical protein
MQGSQGTRRPGRAGGEMRRAPNGYRIVQWADGFYHVYFGSECLAEVLTRASALQIANAHKVVQLSREIVSQHDQLSAAPPGGQET